MLPIFGFLLYVVAMFIASKVYQLRSGFHDVPLAIIGPSQLLLDTPMHPSPIPESVNFTVAEDWLLMLGFIAGLITLVSLWVILIWVSIAHPWFLDEVHDKCFVSTVDIDDALWSKQKARDPEKDHELALKEKDAIISSKVEENSKLETKLCDLQASSARQLEESKSAAAKKLNSMKADNIALRKTLHELKLFYQAISIDHENKLASNEEDFVKFRANSTRQFEEAKSAAAKKYSSIKKDNIALRVSLDELKLNHQTAGIDQERKLASKEEDLLKFRASFTHELEEAKSVAAKIQNSIEADNAALRESLDNLKLSHQAASMEQHSKLASKEEDLLQLRASSTRQLEEAKSVAAKKQSSIKAENAALRTVLDELELNHQVTITEKDKKFELAIQSLENDHNASMLKLQDNLNQQHYLRENSERELAVARAEITEASKKIHDINLERSILRSERDEALADKGSMIDAFQRVVKENSHLVQSHDEATKALGDKAASIASASNAIVLLKVRLQTQKQKTKEANIKSGLLLKSKHEMNRRLRNDTKMLKDELDSKNKLLEDKEAEAKSCLEANAAEIQRLRTGHVKEILEFEKWGQKKFQDMQDDHSKAMSQAKDDLAKATNELERRKTTIEFSAVEEAEESDLPTQLQHHSDYVTRLDRWLPNCLASRKEKLTDHQPEGAQGPEELGTLCCTENPAYIEKLLFAEAGGPSIRLPPKLRVEHDSSSLEEEAETRCCTEYLLFAEAGSPKVRLPNKAQETSIPIPLPPQIDPAGIPLPEDEDLGLLAPEWSPLPEGEDVKLLDLEWVPLPEEKDLEFLMPEEIPLPRDEDLELLPDLPDSEDLDLAPRGPTTKPPPSAYKGSRAIPPCGAPKAPKAMRDGPKRGSSSRGSSWSRGGWGLYK